MLRAAAYCRVSTADQADGASLEAQEAACKEYAQRHGWELVRVYQDVETGRNDQRPEFVQLCQQLPYLDAVICWKVDRMARRAVRCLQFLDQAEAADTEWHSVMDAIDITTSMGRAALGMSASFAQLESEQIGDRVRASIQHRFAQGLWPRKAPYGYVNDKGATHIHEEEAAIVRRVFQEYIEGRTQQEIAEGLQADGLKRRGHRWGREQVCQVLGHPRYIGEPWIGMYERRARRLIRRPRRDWHRGKGLLPAIIERTVWDQVRRQSVPGRRPSQPALFRNLLVCAHCQSRMYVRSWPRMGYQCMRAQGGCAASLVRQEVVVELLRSALHDLREPGARTPVEIQDRNQTEHAFTAAAERVRRAWVAYVEGGVGIDVVRKAQIELGDAETAVQIGARPPLEGRPLRQAVAACRKALKLQDIDEANVRLRGIVARIVVRQDPARVEVVFWTT